MTHTKMRSTNLRFATTVLLALGVFATPSLAQDKKAAAPAAKKTEAPAAKKKKQSAWVKLCEKAPVAKHDKDGKPIKGEEKEICLTHHERLDGNTGMVLVSAAIREIEGSDKKSLMVMVPLGMAIPPGIRAAVYTPEQWEKASKNEKVDEKALKPILLKYSLCHAAGCTAEVVIGEDVVKSMKTGGGLMVLAMNAQAKPIGFPVPLTGFTTAYTGKPVDNKEYAKARSQLMNQIRQRQIAQAKAYREVQKNKKPGESAAPAKEKKK